MSGPDVAIRDLKIKLKRDMVVLLKQNHYVVEDKSKNCVVYPVAQAKDYNECDANYLQSVLPTGLVPIFATDNLDTVTAWQHLDPESFPDKSVDISVRTVSAFCIIAKSIFRLGSAGRNAAF